jgi:hypothetical protein
MPCGAADPDAGPVVRPSAEDSPAAPRDQFTEPSLCLSRILPHAGATYPLAGIQDVTGSRRVLVAIRTPHTVGRIDAKPLRFQNHSAELLNASAK